MSNQEFKEWRTAQIASVILFRCFGNISIQDSNNPLYDMLVTYKDGTGLKFGVNVKSSSFVKSKAYDERFAELANHNFANADCKIPVLLLCVNESQETARFAFQIGWRYGRPRIYKDVELRTLNKANAEKCLEIIKSMDDVIRVLSANDMNVCKKITISKTFGQIQEHADILYLRRLSPNYKMRQKEIVTQKESFDRLLHGIPEEEYPSDLLDESIFKAIQARYPEAKCSSKTILLSTELKDLQFYEGSHMSNVYVRITPDVSTIPQGLLGILNGIEAINIQLQVFVMGIFNVEAFDNEGFTISLPFEGWMNAYMQLKEQLNSLHDISDYFIGQHQPDGIL